MPSTRVLAFTCSAGRPFFLRNCILQMRVQTYPVHHSVYVNGASDTRALYEDLLTNGGLILHFGPTLSQHMNHCEALRRAPRGDYDLFVKVDDDDIYRTDYVEAIVADFTAYNWDCSGTHADGVLNGRNWQPDNHLRSLGLAEADHELGLPETMPATLALSSRAVEHILTLPDTEGFEDVHWRRALAREQYLPHVRSASRFVYHIHGNNTSTAHWLDEPE